MSGPVRIQEQNRTGWRQATIYSEYEREVGAPFIARILTMWLAASTEHPSLMHACAILAYGGTRRTYI